VRAERGGGGGTTILRVGGLWFPGVAAARSSGDTSAYKSFGGRRRVAVAVTGEAGWGGPKGGAGGTGS
jgi:hypothetical protein